MAPERDGCRVVASPTILGPRRVGLPGFLQDPQLVLHRERSPSWLAHGPLPSQWLAIPARRPEKSNNSLCLAQMSGSAEALHQFLAGSELAAEPCHVRGIVGLGGQRRWGLAKQGPTRRD